MRDPHQPMNPWIEREQRAWFEDVKRWYYQLARERRSSLVPFCRVRPRKGGS